MAEKSPLVSKFNRQTAHEGKLTEKIEQQTAKIPSVGFLSLAIGSMLASAGIQFFSKRKDVANFVGLWVPSLLLIGIYNKLVKIENERRWETSVGREAA